MLSIWGERSVYPEEILHLMSNAWTLDNISTCSETLHGTLYINASKILFEA